ncbi:septum site-determining protein MinC [Caenimonas sedimenti]|uniref:Probable septum site-determining protein MinC n=1 Tax=Caenimonas sedimenti TaxID=2596921 RepID=A0A562ZRX3_9BURK|nr:septum site-determining protein MinC [Caenimonas sedimenti]TWO71096.1 septum site-determining protein MinC [Caenimonas sedimenti]
MTVSLAGRAPATFELKSANLPLLALLLKTADLGQLAQEMQVRFGDMPDFFDHDPLVIDLAPLPAEAMVDFDALLEVLKPYRVVPVAVKGGNAGQLRAAQEAGLALSQEADVVAARAPAPALPQGGREEVNPSALVIEKPLRSGQQAYARGRDLVVLAMVNAGAEVIADGHIHVYAPLRGKAIAGARGNTEARIFTQCLEPELVSIAGIYRSFEEPLPADLQGRPKQIRLEGSKLRIQGIP